MVKLNKPWLGTIPEFSVLIKRDKGSDGDYDGRKKLKATKEITYIYYMVAFESPVFWGDEEGIKRSQSLSYAGLEEKDIDGEVMEALETFEMLQYEASPTLKSLNKLKKAWQKMDKFYDDIDFAKTDKQGKLQFTTTDFLSNVKNIGAALETLTELEKRVMEELRNDTGIRGKSEKGDNEGKPRKEWVEGGPKGAQNKRTFVQLGAELEKDEEINHDGI